MSQKVNKQFNCRMLMSHYHLCWLIIQCTSNILVVSHQRFLACLCAFFLWVERKIAPWLKASSVTPSMQLINKFSLAHSHNVACLNQQIFFFLRLPAKRFQFHRKFSTIVFHIKIESSHTYHSSEKLTLYIFFFHRRRCCRYHQLVVKAQQLNWK